MSPPFRLERCKELVREAASGTRDLLFRTIPHHPHAQQQLARTIVPVVWRQDVRVARLLLSSHPLAADFLDCSQHGVAFRHAGSFQQWSDRAQLEAAELAREEIRRRRASEGNTQQLRRMTRSLERRARVWSPLNRRVFLAAVAADGHPDAAADPLARLVEP